MQKTKYIANKMNELVLPQRVGNTFPSPAGVVDWDPSQG